jgi:hypothetical protein
MADRTVLTPVVLTTPQLMSPVANAADFAYAVSDLTNGNRFVHTGKELLLVQNVNVAAKTVTIAGKADELGRTGSIPAYSMGASEFAVFGPFTSEAFRQADGYVWIDVEHADIKLAVIRLP